MNVGIKFKKWLIYMKSAFGRIHLVDRCLLIFMIILLAQSAYSLFFPGTMTEEIGSIDVIIRTSSAAIFGYFLSANFVRDVPEQGKESVVSDDTGEVRLQELEETKEEKNPHGMPVSNRMQIIIASVIGIFCLTVLILLRDLAELGQITESSNSVAATVTQFRDFVSGCVGFLIGCPTNSEK